MGTEHEIFVKLSLQKIYLLKNTTPDSASKMVKSQSFLTMDKSGTLMRTVAAEREADLVFDIFPKEHGFKEVFPGESYKSHKMWKMLKGFKGAAYLTVLTKEFVLEDKPPKGTPKGKDRIDKNPVNSKTYKASLNNLKLGGLGELQKQELIIGRSNGKHVVKKSK